MLTVKPGLEDDFMVDFERARPLLSSTTGILGLQLKRSIETPHHFLFLVSWETVPAHTEGFRGSANYETWKDLLHHFHDPFPVVEHFERIEPAAPAH